VDRVETSEAALIGTVDRKFGAQGRKHLEESYYRHGKEFGTRLIREAGIGIDDLEGIQEILETYCLEGMPCDGGATSQFKGSGELVFTRPVGLHSHYWEKTGVSSSLMVDLGGKWIEGILNGINPGFMFERRRAESMVMDWIRKGKAQEKETPKGGDAPKGADDFIRRVNDALEQIKPMLAMDGGGIELVSADPVKKTVAVRLLGACHGCMGAQMTLQYGVEKALRERVPELVEMEVV